MCNTLHCLMQMATKTQVEIANVYELELPLPPPRNDYEEYNEVNRRSSQNVVKHKFQKQKLILLGITSLTVLFIVLIVVCFVVNAELYAAIANLHNVIDKEDSKNRDQFHEMNLSISNVSWVLGRKLEQHDNRLIDLESFFNNSKSQSERVHHLVKDTYILNGWYAASNSHFYKQSERSRNYVNSKAECEKFGARLESTGIRDSKIRKEIEENVKTTSVYSWIGLDRTSQDNEWAWSDGGLYDMNSTAWGENEPNNEEGDEKCAHLTKLNDINDISCSRYFYYICEV
ncbi:uncharacterized protein LOC144429773 [Styela clava]